MIALIITGIQGEPSAYLASKFLAAGVEPSCLTPAFLRVASSQGKQVNPALAALDLSETTKEPRSIGGPPLSVLRKQVDRALPLLAEETIVKDELCVLRHAVDDLEPHTVGLRRHTNRAEMTVFFPNRRPDAPDVDSPCHPAETPDGARLPHHSMEIGHEGAKGDHLTATPLILAARLARGLTVGYGGRRACGVFPALLGPRPIDFFDRFYREMTRAVGHRLPEQTQVWLGDEFDHFLGFCQVLARTAHDLTGPSQGILEGFDTAVSTHEQRLASAIDLWSQLPGKAAALGWFGCAVCGHLALLQEAAYRDPRVRQPWQSNHALRLATLARDYAAMIDTQRHTLTGARLDRISVRHTLQVWTQPHYSLLTKGIHWVDEVQGRLGPLHAVEASSSEVGSIAAKRAHTERDRYCQSFAQQFSRTLMPLGELVESLFQLAEAPLPEPILGRPPLRH